MVEKGFSNLENILDKETERTNHLLAIAINAYIHCPKLNNAVKDVQDFITVIQEKYNFEPQNIKTLFDGEATKANVLNAFRDLASRLTPQDNLIIYFSGHGEYDEVFGEGYWIPVEAPKGAFDEYIPNTTIKLILGRINTHHTFLIADSCFSGSLFIRGARDISNRLEKNPSRWGLTSGQKEIVSDGKPGENSPFAESLLYHLQNSSDSIGVQELCYQVLETVVAQASQTPLGEPLQVDGHKNGQFVFRLKKDEKREWLFAKKIGTTAAIQQFLAAYPDSTFKAEAHKALEIAEEKTAFDRAVEQNTIRALVEFKNTYPNSTFLAEAKAKISNLEEVEAWEEAKKYNNYSALNNYLTLYPNGQFANDAKERINVILNKTTTKSTDSNSVQPTVNETSIDKKWVFIGIFGAVIVTLLIVFTVNYFAFNPINEDELRFEIYLEDGDDAYWNLDYEEAVFNYGKALDINQNAPYPKKMIRLIEQEERAYQTALKSNSIDNYERYLQTYPDGKYAENARQRLTILRSSSATNAFDLAKNTNTIAAYEQYLKDYPNGSRSEEAKESIKRLKAQEDKRAFDAAKSKNTIAAYQAYMDKYPNGAYVKDAKLAIRRLQRDAAQQQEGNKEANYQRWLKQAYLYYERKAYAKAKSACQQALLIDPSGKEARELLAKLEDIEKARYQELLKQADLLYQQQNFDAAKLKYQEASKIQATDYTKERLLNIDRQTNIILNPNIIKVIPPTGKEGN